METQDITFVTKEEKTWAMFAHLATFCGLVLPFFGNIIGPLVIWLLKKDTLPFVDEQGKEALNFQISMMIYALIASISMIVLIGFLLLPAVILFDFIFTIIAIIKVNEGVHYKYPLCIRFIK